MIKYILLIFLTYNLYSSQAGDDAQFEPRFIIDMPNAGVLTNKHLAFSALAYTDGGVMIDFTAAFFDRFNIGLSYGASRIIGSGTPVGQRYPGISLKYRIINEKTNLPAIALGVSTQGRGNWINKKGDKTLNRFETHSPGIYIVGSKNFTWTLGDVSFHGGLGYSIDPAPEDRLPNIWAGLEQNLGEDFSFVTELNFMLDSRDYEITSDVPLFNIGLKWSASDNLTIQLQFRDLLGTYKDYHEFTRYVGFDFVSPF